MHNEFEYTKAYDVTSSLVEGVYYNENDQTLTLDLNDEYYRYSNVSPADVGRLVEQPSVGSYFNRQFKHAFGPGEYLGTWVEVNEVCVPVTKDTPGTPKGLEDQTATYDLNRFENVDAFTTDTTPTKEYSLEDPETPVATRDDVAVSVAFTLEGFDKEFFYDAKADNVEDAVEELHAHVSAFGAKGKVRRVVVEFE